MKEIETMTATVTQKWIVCRVCLQQPKETMGCIFNDDATKDLTNMILECGGVPIKRFDHYPDKICDKCLKCLHIAHKFRRNCQRSYKHLSQFIAPVVVEHAVSHREIIINHELPEEIEHEILVDIEKDLDVNVKNEQLGEGEQEGNEEELYDVYEYDGSQQASDQANEQYVEEITEHSLSGLSGEIEYIEQVDQDQLTESAHEDEIEVQQNTSDEEYIPDERPITTRARGAAAASSKRRINARKPPAKILKGTISKIKLSGDETITIGDTVVRKSAGIKTRGGRKVLVGDKKEYKYICDICGNMYPSQSRLTEHIKVHSGIKPHECEICGHCFAQAQQLARHMNTHTGNRPYKCSYCPAAFADLSTRNKHHRIHTNERPYECDVCHKTFTYTNTLKFHKMIHTGEKPHVCDICGKGFPQAYKLRNHRITHQRRPVRDTLGQLIAFEQGSIEEWTGVVDEEIKDEVNL